MPNVHFLGTGNAFHQDGRGSACLLVEPGAGAPFLVDVGPTAAAAISRFGIEAEPIDALFVTHLHGDHVAGWPFLLLNLSMILRRQRPFDIYGPLGSRTCLEQLARLSYGELLERPGFEIRYHEYEVAEHCAEPTLLGTTFDLLPMEHHPTSLGFRFSIPEGEERSRVGVTGDTAWCRNLERLSETCDLLVLECTSPEPTTAPHVSLAELRDRLDRLGAEQVVLTHLTDAVAERLALDPLPRVVAAYDGMVWQPQSVSSSRG